MLYSLITGLRYKELASGVGYRREYTRHLLNIVQCKKEKIDRQNISHINEYIWKGRGSLNNNEQCVCACVCGRVCVYAWCFVVTAKTEDGSEVVDAVHSLSPAEESRGG